MHMCDAGDWADCKGHDIVRSSEALPGVAVGRENLCLVGGGAEERD